MLKDVSKKVMTVLLMAVTIICFLITARVRFFSSSDKVLINVRSGDSA
jgi:uncharacterized protein YraI